MFRFWEGNGFREPVPEPVPGTAGSGRQVLPFRGTSSGFQWVPTADTKVPGSEGCVPESSKVSMFDGFRWVRFCSPGLDGTGSGNQVPETRGIKKVPCSGDSVPKVPNITFYFERALLYFENILLYSESVLLYFQSVLLYFESILVYFGNITLHFESILVYFESILLYSESVLLYFQSIYFRTVKVYLRTLKIYFCSLKVYLCALEIYFCSLKVYLCTLEI